MFCLHLVDELVSSVLTKMSTVLFSFLLAMSEVFYICPGVITPASRVLSLPFF